MPSESTTALGNYHRPFWVPQYFQKSCFPTMAHCIFCDMSQFTTPPPPPLPHPLSRAPIRSIPETRTSGNHNNNAGRLEILEVCLVPVTPVSYKEGQRSQTGVSGEPWVWVAESGVWPQILLRLHCLSDRVWGGAQDGKVRTVEPLATFIHPNTSTYKRNTKDRIKVCLKPQ